MNFSDPGSFWLNVTNLALGGAVLACIVVIARAVVQELTARRRTDPYAISVEELGMMMADGGEELDDDRRR